METQDFELTSEQKNALDLMISGKSNSKIPKYRRQYS